jgi:hypothetical protein
MENVSSFHEEFLMKWQSLSAECTLEGTPSGICRTCNHMTSPFLKGQISEARRHFQLLREDKFELNYLDIGG